MCISKLFKLPKKNLIIIAGVILVFLLIIFWGSLFGSKKSSGGAKKLVLIIQNAEHPALNATRRGILELLQSNKDIKVTFQSAQDQDLLASQIAKKFVSANPLPAVMVGIGTMATQALIATRGNNLIPIVFSSVTDPMNFKSIKIPNSPDSMITGVSSYIDPSLHFDLFKKNLTKSFYCWDPL